MAQSAGAADLPRKAPVLKAAPYAAWNWTGLYVGGYVGVGVSRSRGHDPDNVPTGDIEHTGFGFSGGGTVGYNYQLNSGILGQKWVIGAEGDIGYFDTSNRIVEWNDPLLTHNTKTSWLATARARVGLTDGPNLNYFTAGFAALNLKDINTNTATGFEVSSSKTETGYVFGSGIETMLGNGWSAKTESLYVNVESGDTLTNATNGFSIQNDKRRFYTQRFGVNYQFGAGKNGPLPQTNWSGLYVGGVFGGSSSTSRATALNPALVAGEIGNNGTGLNAGGQIGYNWMIAPKWVVGVEGDISYLGIDHTSTDFFDAGSSQFKVDTSWIATARGRVAYNTGPALLYATGGGAWVNLKEGIITVLGTGTVNSTTLSGWTVGGGIETVLWGNWSSKTEYLYVDAGKGDTLGAFVGVVPSTADYKFHLFRSGITYRFGNNPLAWRL